MSPLSRVRTAEPAVREESTGQLLSDITSDLQTLFRQELELAKAELKEEGIKAARLPGCSAAPVSPATWSCCSCRWRPCSAWPR
ncbi:phage holin family protein [Streptomyces albogriseolus]|nr:phage holin family protein [Streptomyces albogriseolus]